MNKLLVICPSMSRSKRIEEFLETFTTTKSEGTHLILGLEHEDPELQAYFKLSEKYDFGIGVFKGDNITQIFNAIALNSDNDYQYYMPINDDFVFNTPGWDTLLIEEIEKHGKGIAWPNDLFQNTYPSTSVISGDIVKALGWLQMPTLTHLCGDIVWATIGQKVDCIYKCSDVIIEHKHFVTGKSESDSISNKTNSKEMYDKDWAAYNQWLEINSNEDIEKVKKVCQQ